MIDARELFVHKQAIRSTNQRFFTGRRELLSRALDAIAVPGSAIAIYGDPGVGKTSFGWQLMEALRGNHTLLRRLGISPQHHVDTYWCCWTQYNQGISDLEDVLLSLMMHSEKEYTLSWTFPDVFTGKLKSRIERAYELNFGVAKVGAKFTPEGRQQTPSEVASSLASKTSQVHFLFQEVLVRIRKLYPTKELIIFFDDFERIPSIGMGSLIKDTNDARFVIIGSGDDVVDVIADHTSSGRKLEGSKFLIPGLDPAEVNSVFSIAEGIYPGLVRFDQGFRNLVLDNCDGYPWLVQLLGYHAVLPKQKEVDREHPLMIEANDFDSAADTLASPFGDVERYEQLVKAVGTSPAREQLLFVLASEPPGWVSEAKVKSGHQATKSARKHIENHLSALEHEGIIRRDRQSSRVRFKNPILRAIVKFAERRGSISKR